MQNKLKQKKGQNKIKNKTKKLDSGKQKQGARRLDSNLQNSFW